MVTFVGQTNLLIEHKGKALLRSSRSRSEEWVGTAERYHYHFRFGDFGLACDTMTCVSCEHAAMIACEGDPMPQCTWNLVERIHVLAPRSCHGMTRSARFEQYTRF